MDSSHIGEYVMFSAEGRKRWSNQDGNSIGTIVGINSGYNAYPINVLWKGNSETYEYPESALQIVKVPIFKEGDRIINDSPVKKDNYGKKGRITRISGTLTVDVLYDDGCQGSGYMVLHYKLLNSKSFFMSIIETFKLSLKSEPEKTFIKAGIVDQNGDFTNDGKLLFNAYLLKKFGDDFKKDVVDPILAEQKEEAKK